MTDLSLASTRTAYDSGQLTPASLQSMRLVGRRRLFFAMAFFASFAALAYGFYIGLGLSHETFPSGEAIVFIFLLFLLPWHIVGFWNAGIGLWLLHGRRDGIEAVAPYLAKGPRPLDPSQRVAVLMTIRNEDPLRALVRLSIMRDSLDRTGEGAIFDYFILSDTSDASIAEKEEALCKDWRRRYGEDARLIYRRRERNIAYKAGNIRDFLERWGSHYELMLTLDADSLMTGEAILRMVSIMQAYPRLGILQSLIVGAPTKSAFARLFQFGMRHGMRSYTMGSAWWTADCGPYWGHNAVIRVKPFYDHCDLPPLPGKPPLGGHVLSHDQIEAAFMRKAGYEVRVLPIEGGSFEDNPPTLLEFAKRDLRWCQGNMQYVRLIGYPGLLFMSRLQIGLAILMYAASLAAVFAVASAAIVAASGGFRHVDPGAMITMTAVLTVMSIAPKFAGLADALLSHGGAARYGGARKLLTGACFEFAFSYLLAPALNFRAALFTASLPFGRAIGWNGQMRDAHRVHWQEAFALLWAQLAAGVALAALIALYAPAALIWAFPISAALILAAPIAIFTASPAMSNALAKRKLCAIPEEFEECEVLTAASRAELFAQIQHG